MIEPAFRTILTTNSGVQAAAPGGIHFNALPQNERRASVVLTTTTHTNYKAMDGSAGYATGTIQVDCYADDYKAAKLLAEACRVALDNYEGAVADTTIGFIDINDISDIPAKPLAGQAAPLFGVSLTANYLTL